QQADRFLLVRFRRPMQGRTLIGVAGGQSRLRRVEQRPETLAISQRSGGKGIVMRALCEKYIRDFPMTLLCRELKWGQPGSPALFSLRQPRLPLIQRAVAQQEFGESRAAVVGGVVQEGRVTGS